MFGWVGIGDGGAGYLVISNLLQGMSGTLNHSPSMDLTDLRRSEGLGGRLEGPGGPHSVLNQLLGVNINNIVLCNILFRSDNLLF